MSAIITLEPTADGGTSYIARALHKDSADRERHSGMVFAEGWGNWPSGSRHPDHARHQADI